MRVIKNSITLVIKEEEQFFVKDFLDMIEDYHFSYADMEDILSTIGSKIDVACTSDTEVRIKYEK